MKKATFDKNHSGIIVYIKYMIVAINVIAVCIPVIDYIYKVLFPFKGKQYVFSVSSIIVVCLQILLIVLGKYHDSKVEYNILGDNKKNILQKINPHTQNELEKARNEMREGLTILMVVSVACMIVCFFTGYLKINIAIAVGLAMVIAYIYADYLPHANRYAMEYDALFCRDGKPNAIRGLARIYLDEYKQDKFECDGESEWELYDKDHDDIDSTKEFIKCVFSIRAAMVDQTLEIIMWVMFVISALTIKPDVYHMLFQYIVSDDVAKLLIQSLTLIAPMVFMAVSICQLYECYFECDVINRLFAVIKKDDFDEMLFECEKVLKEPRGELCRIRGRFVFTEKYMEKYRDISSVPMKYRMKFRDRYIANKVRYLYTYLLIVIIGILLMLEIEWLESWLWITYVLILIIGFFIGEKIFLPNLNRRKIRKQCVKLCIYNDNLIESEGE